MSETSLVAGVELGGTKVVCTLAAGPDDVRDQMRFDTTSPDVTMQAVKQVLIRWIGAHDVRAIGIASFGPIDLDPTSKTHGRIVNTPKRGWSGADVLGGIAALGPPVVIDTDVAGAALAEGRWGAARGLSSFAYVTVGTGVGVGLVVEGRSVRGRGHVEAGHLRVSRPAMAAAFPGVCPYHGDCVEGLASGPAIQARAGMPANQLPPDHPAWDEAVHALAGLCHNLVLTALPQRILIGGGVGMGQPHLLPRIRQAVFDSLGGYGPAPLTRDELDTFLVHPALGDRAGPLGAVALGLTALGL